MVQSRLLTQDPLQYRFMSSSTKKAIKNKQSLWAADNLTFFYSLARVTVKIRLLLPHNHERST